MSNPILPCTVGGSPQPILKAIESTSPCYVCFFCTGRDPGTGKPGSIDQITREGGAGPLRRCGCALVSPGGPCRLAAVGLMDTRTLPARAADSGRRRRPEARAIAASRGAPGPRPEDGVNDDARSPRLPAVRPVAPEPHPDPHGAAGDGCGARQECAEAVAGRGNLAGPPPRSLPCSNTRNETRSLPPMDNAIRLKRLRAQEETSWRHRVRFGRWNFMAAVVVRRWGVSMVVARTAMRGDCCCASGATVGADVSDGALLRGSPPFAVRRTHGGGLGAAAHLRLGVGIRRPRRSRPVEPARAGGFAIRTSLALRSRATPFVANGRLA